MNSFYERWKDKGDEKSDTQNFWYELLRWKFKIDIPSQYIEFEKRVELSHMSFIDAYIKSTGIIIEQKSIDFNLDAPAKQSDGTLATPFEQAKRYYDNLPYSMKGKYIIICNFKEFRIHNMETPKAEPQIIGLEDIERENLDFLVKPERELTHEEIISMEAGRLAGKLYDALRPRYALQNAAALRSLNIFCVRIVFLLYAEDSGLFPKSAFHDYLSERKNTARDSILKLFRILSQKEEERDPYLEDEMKIFPYLNGGLFEEEIEIPKIDGEPLRIIIEDMSEKFNWNEISPPIFGAIFESTLNPETRIEGGMHYTTIKNIQRVINPLFLDGLTQRLESLMKNYSGKSRIKKLIEFQNELASLTFLDPACGSGNFLTESYLSLRRLENKIIEELSHGQMYFGEGEFTPIKVSISQFYGIEINDFAVAVARTALYIAEHQMRRETEKIVVLHDSYTPLKTYQNIHEANAVQINWADVINPERLNYIMGNPPFRGARIIAAGNDQKKDIAAIFKGWGSLGNFDYVCCWYKKAHDFMKGTKIKAALVSTNSINQGDTVSIFWKPLIDDGMTIDFAHRTFIWNSESDDKAHVHCVIIGFSSHDDTGIKTSRGNAGNSSDDTGIKSSRDNTVSSPDDTGIKTSRDNTVSSLNDTGIKTSRGNAISASDDTGIKSSRRNKNDNVISSDFHEDTDQRMLYDVGINDTVIKTPAHHINAYLLDAPDWYIFKRDFPVTPGIPLMRIGNKPIDNGLYLFTREEYEEFIRTEPEAKKYFHVWYGGQEFLYNTPRMCLYLGECTPHEINMMPECKKRVDAVRAFRLASRSIPTQKLADTPNKFHVTTLPKGKYIVVPKTSSERRKYIPMGFLDDSVMCADSLRVIPNANLYHFGVLESLIHMAWMRVVAGRLKSDYSYSNTLVYNCFVWPCVNDKQRSRIESTAQGILDARGLYPDSNLAELYDESLMPIELRKAHRANDEAVRSAYGFRRGISELEIVSGLFGMYDAAIMNGR